MNRNVDDVWKITGLGTCQKPEVFLIPGEDKLRNTNLHDQLGSYPIQKGELPSARAGHQVFRVSENKVCVIGGHNLAAFHGPFKTFIHPEYSLYLFDVSQYAWQVVEVNQESSLLLSRSNFGACFDGNSIYICGGVRKIDARVEPINVYSIIKLMIIDNGAGRPQGVLSVIEIASDIEYGLSSCTLTKRIEKLYIYGGNTGKKSAENKDFERNGSLIILDLQNKTAVFDVPTYLEGMSCQYFQLTLQC